MNNLVGNALLSSFDIDEITSEALLLQTGYLTFGKTLIQEDEKYDRLCYPNREVRQNLRAPLSRMGGAVVSRLFRLRTRERGWAGMGGRRVRRPYGVCPFQKVCPSERVCPRGVSPACARRESGQGQSHNV